VVTYAPMTESPQSLSWVLSFVRSSFHPRPPGEVVYRHFVNRLWSEMAKAQVPGILTATQDQALRGQTFQFSAAPRHLQDLTVEAFFYLIRNSYVVENCALDPPLNHPQSQSYRWTERGLRWVESAEPIPEYAAKYLDFLRSRVPSLDLVIEQYVKEALTAFERQAHFAAAVMLGAACEKALYLLAESLLVAIADRAKNERLQGLLKDRKLHRLFVFVQDAVRKGRDTKVLPYEIHEGADTHLMSIYEAVRVQRNDAVHPINAAVSETSVRFLLVGFPYALEKTEALRTWFSSNTLNI
jgi:hypothetical protein